MVGLSLVFKCEWYNQVDSVDQSNFGTLWSGFWTFTRNPDQKGWVANGPDYGIWNLETQPFEIQTNSRHFVKNHFNSGQKCLDFKWLGLWLLPRLKSDYLKTIPFEIWPSKSPDFKCFGILNGFQIPTVINSRIQRFRFWIGAQRYDRKRADEMLINYFVMFAYFTLGPIQ